MPALCIGFTAQVVACPAIFHKTWNKTSWQGRSPHPQEEPTYLQKRLKHTKISRVVFSLNSGLITIPLEAFPAALSDPTNDPFFSVENATTWITSLGFQLYLLQYDTVVLTPSYNPEDSSTKELMVVLGHAFFSLENTAAWINPGTFQAYMTDNQDSIAQHRYAFDDPEHKNLPTSAANDAMVPVEASDEYSRYRKIFPFLKWYTVTELQIVVVFQMVAPLEIYPLPIFYLSGFVGQSCPGVLRD
ncbi:hypothetical protein B0H13DRAFT_1903568 [Mycena leptocephala]|nr:hypothetical protein B0H13DRAFT_1903568 [Mycena leptocephala]